MIIPSSRDDDLGVDHIIRSPATPSLFMARDRTKSRFFHTTIVKDCGLNMFLATMTSSSSSSPSPPGADSPESTDTLANGGFVTVAAVCWLLLNAVIALCLVWSKNLKRAKKVARNEALELSAGDLPAELKEDGIHDLDLPPLELTEDTFHEMFVPPVELSGDLWPELDGRPS